MACECMRHCEASWARERASDIEGILCITLFAQRTFEEVCAAYAMRAECHASGLFFCFALLTAVADTVRGDLGGGGGGGRGLPFTVYNTYHTMCVYLLLLRWR